MRKFYLKRLAAVALIGGSLAATSSAFAVTDLHVGPDSSGGPGTDPNLIASNSKFFVADINGHTIASPLDLYFAVPDSGSPSAPSITKVTLNGSTPVTFSFKGNLGLWTGSPDKGLYAYVGCAKCDKSLSFTNFNDALTTNGIGVPSLGYEVYEYQVNTGFGKPPSKPDVEVQGAFGQGTFIAPLGFDGDKFYETSFTNTGLITTGSGVPEASTWGMMLLGFAGLGFFGLRGRKAIAVAG